MDAGKRYHGAMITSMFCDCKKLLLWSSNELNAIDTRNAEGKNGQNDLRSWADRQGYARVDRRLKAAAADWAMFRGNVICQCTIVSLVVCHSADLKIIEGCWVGGMKAGRRLE